MTLKIQDAGTLRTISLLTIKQAGVNRTIRTLKVMDGGVLRTVANFIPALSLSASPLARTVNGSSSTLTTADITATPSGGSAPFTYVWANVANGGADASTANSPTSATTTFTKTGLMPGNNFTDTWEVTVTDSLGSTASAVVTATFNYVT